MLNGWAILIRLTRGLITKTLTNYRAEVHNVRSGSPSLVGLTIFASTI